MSDVRIQVDGATATVEGDTDAGVEFVDSWLLGVLTVEDAGRVTITSEAVNDLRYAARKCEITVEEVTG
jgi:hypothetical protein